MAKKAFNLKRSQKFKKEVNPSIANAPTKKKISFFAAMMVVVGSAIGAGIFFKSQTVLVNSQSSIIFAIFSWLLAAFAVISMGLALIEIGSARNDNLSVIGWTQTFNNRIIYKACKNFMVYINLPMTYFFMPFYTILSFQDGIASIYIQTGHIYNGLNTHADWAIMMLIALGITIYFIVVCGLSTKAGNIQNLIISAFKFLPLVLAAVLGFVIIGMLGKIQGNYAAGFIPSQVPSTVGDHGASASDVASTWSFNTLTPGIGLFIAMGAIFFAYDGFYVAAGIQGDMKDPKKTPWAILVGLLVITVIYLLIAISMSLGSKNGNPYGYGSFLFGKKAPWVYSIFQILIGVGVLGIINGFGLWSSRFIEDLIKTNEVPFSTKLVSKLRNDGKAVVGIWYNIAVVLPLFLIFSIIGGLGYVDFSGYASASFISAQDLAGSNPKMFGELIISAHNYFVSHPNVTNTNILLSDINGNEKAIVDTIYNHIVKDGNLINNKALITYYNSLFSSNGLINHATIVYSYGTGLAQLYSFCDLLSTWTSVLTFAFIVFSIGGGLRNRKTKKVKTQQSKYFVPMGIIVMITMLPAIFITFFTPIINLFLLFRVPELGHGQANNTFMIGTIMTVVVLFIYVFLTFGPTMIEDAILKRKYGSIANAEKEQLIQIAHAKNIDVQTEVINNLIIQKRTTLKNWEIELLGRDQLSEQEINEINGDNPPEEFLDDVKTPSDPNAQKFWDENMR